VEGEAAALFRTHIADPIEQRRITARAEELLREVDGSGFAHSSPILPLGYAQRLSALADAVRRYTLDADADIDSVEQAAERVRKHDQSHANPVEAERLLRDAKDVDVDAWMVTSADLSRADWAKRIVLSGATAEVTTGTKVRNVVFSRLASLVDLRWKAALETRVVALQPDEGGVVLVSAKQLEVDGPSRVGAVLKLQLELQQVAMAALKDRVVVQVLTPQQVGVPLDTPAELVALALVEGVRRRSNRGRHR
jgi:hypothetical protein